MQLIKQQEALKLESNKKLLHKLMKTTNFKPIINTDMSSNTNYDFSTD